MSANRWFCLIAFGLLVLVVIPAGILTTVHLLGLRQQEERRQRATEVLRRWRGEDFEPAERFQTPDAASAQLMERIPVLRELHELNVELAYLRLRKRRLDLMANEADVFGADAISRERRRLQEHQRTTYQRYLHAQRAYAERYREAEEAPELESVLDKLELEDPL